MEDFGLFSRRDFLKDVGKFSALALWAGACESCANLKLPTRRNISNLAPNDPIIDTYKAAVTAMQALDMSNPNDPRGWSKQAQIHFDHCPHGNWWFLPWHRAYLGYFEQICRKLTGNNDFALPYWNWTTNPSIPGVFWGNGNPLFDNTRLRNAASVADPSFVGPTVINNILNEPNFFLFASLQAVNQRDAAGYGMLEQTPHNYIHGWINGHMGTYHSPLDPVFWCHHNILDCLWVDWNDKGNANTNDPNWANLKFTEFVDGDGNPVTITAAETLLFLLFSYQFEPCSPPLRMKRKQLEKLLREGAPVKLEFTQRFKLAQALSGEVGKPLTGGIKVEPEAFRGALEAGGKTAVVLTVGGVEVPDKTDYFVRVFLGKPDASASTPLDDPHYAGSFAFFFDSSAMPNMAGHPKPGYLVDVTPTLRKLSQAGSLSAAQVDVSVIPVPYEGRQATGQPLALDRLELGIARF